jgi:hypothetical protein
MKHAVHHDLDLDTARKATDHALESYKDRFSEYNPQVTWKDDRRAEVAFNAKGVTLKGVFELLDDRVEMDMDVPFVFRLFKKKAIDVIEREIRRWLDKAKNGELDGE